MRWAALLGLFAACGHGADASPPPTPTNEPAPVESPPEPTLAPAPAPSPPPDGPLHTALGAEIATVEGATRVEVARMRVIGAERAEQATLRASSTILGYPIVGDTRVLDATDARELTALVLAEDHYDTETFARCANAEFYGARFTLDERVVELALGMPCEQALWASSHGRWGALLRTPSATEVVRILGASP